MTGFEAPADAPTVAVTAVGQAEGSRGAAAALACAGAGVDLATLLVDVGGKVPRPTLLASAAARSLEERLAGHLPKARVAARGQVCHLAVPADGEGLEAAAAAVTVARGALAVLHMPPRLLRASLDQGPGPKASGVLLRADLTADRALLALVVRDLIDRDFAVAVLKQRLSWVAERRAFFGSLSPDAAGGLPAAQIGRVTALPQPSTPAISLSTEARPGAAGPAGDPLSRDGREGSQRWRRSIAGAAEESGQALILALGGTLVLLAGALALVAIAGAVTGKGRVQRAADLAAISAARSMRDDLPKLLAPPTLANGLPNPARLDKSAYLARARLAAVEVGKENGLDPDRLRLIFPDSSSFAPVRAKVSVVARLEVGTEREEVEASAEAEAAAPLGAGGGASAMATGGGYGGPLVFRTGEGMRPDVAAAFDRMAAAARGAGVSLLVVSGFRSDAEQAALFAAHPDPTWVAPPGHSLHRCATELDLGPESAYGWLAANASRFGFVQRYSWEAWHYGFDAGPTPCSEAGNALSGTGGGATGAGVASVPGFVPSRFRAPLIAAATRWSVPAALLAAQLMAESGFDPFAVSPAGAQGIAQFMPGTAASYGLNDPFDPVAAIDAQAHLMSDLIRQLGSPELALAGYNAGPGAVEGCDCIPPYPETQAYVTRILALLGGVGALAVPSFEVRLVA